MKIADSTAFVTGANRGLGLRFATLLRDRGATVYAGARDPATVTLEGVIPVRIDVTDPRSVALAAAAAPGVDLLVNNAGTYARGALLGDGGERLRAELETHVHGPLAVTRAFLPSLAAHGGAVVDVLSVLSWISLPGTGAYSIAKAAGWALANGLRLELADHGVTVTTVHVGYMDTDMAAGVEGPKTDPAVVAALALDAVEAGEPEVLVDDVSRQVRAGLAGGVAALYPTLAPAR